MQAQKAVWLCGVFVMAAGCATATGFRSTWRNPETKPFTLDGQKVVVFVISTQESMRRAAEDTVAGQITARGAQGVPSWTILPIADMQSEDKTRAAFGQAGAVGVVTMEIVGMGRDSGPSNLRGSVGFSNRRSFWANYRWAWGATWHSGPPPSTAVWVETLVYSLEPDELLWAGRSRTVNPPAVSALFGEVADAVAREMESADLLRGSAR